VRSPADDPANKRLAPQAELSDRPAGWCPKGITAAPNHLAGPAIRGGGRLAHDKWALQLYRDGRTPPLRRSAPAGYVVPSPLVEVEGSGKRAIAK
jgi:hypothetical protein